MTTTGFTAEQVYIGRNFLVGIFILVSKVPLHALTFQTINECFLLGKKCHEFQAIFIAFFTSIFSCVFLFSYIRNMSLFKYYKEAYGKKCQNKKCHRPKKCYEKSKK